MNKAKSLNKFFEPLQLNLIEADLRGFNLTNITFKNMFLAYTKLQGARLTKFITIPDYGSDLTCLFKKWIEGDEDTQKIYQNLVNASFNIFTLVDHKVLCEGIKLKKNLENSCLANINLQGADLTKANLKNALLMNTILTNTDLSGANLTYANLKKANLKNANLKNANLRMANLTEAKIEGIKLKGAQIGKAKLSFKLVLPEDDRDESLRDFYTECNSQYNKWILEDDQYNYTDSGLYFNNPEILNYQRNKSKLKRRLKQILEAREININ